MNGFVLREFKQGITSVMCATCLLQVCVADVLGGGKFYVQTEEAKVLMIQKTLEGLNLKDKASPPGVFTPQKGELVIAQFSSDNSWNRALVSQWLVIV